MDNAFALTTLGLAIAASLPLAKSRLELSLDKHPSLTGHSRMAKLRLLMSSKACAFFFQSQSQTCLARKAFSPASVKLS